MTIGGWNAIACSMGSGAASAYGTQRTTKPIQYTDDTPMTVPVLEFTGPPAYEAFETSALESARTEADKAKQKDKSVWGFIRRQSPSFNTLSDRQVNVTIKKVLWRDYLKYYAKDEHGRYMGTEDPAVDCMLNEEDSARWRGTMLKEASEKVPERARVRQDEPKAVLSTTPAPADVAIPRPQEAIQSGGKKSKFGLFKGSKGGNSSDGVIR